MADHHHAVQFRSRLALDLIARATRRGGVDDLSGAIEDLDLAERIGAPPDSLAAARLSLADRVADEVRVDLDAGEPIRVLERVEELAGHKISGPALRRAREIAEAWQNGLADGRRGEFGRAQEYLDRADRLASGAGAIAAQQAVAVAKAEMDNRQKGAASKVEALYAALSDGKWPQILSAAEAVLTCVPEHPAARQARSRAWQQIAAISPTAARWPQRTPRGPQASPAIGPIEDPDVEHPVQPVVTEPSDGIVWLSAGTSREAYQPPAAAARIAEKKGGLAGGPAQPFENHRKNAPARPLARVEAVGAQRPVPSLGRCRGRLSRLPG